MKKKKENLAAEIEEKVSLLTKSQQGIILSTINSMLKDVSGKKKLINAINFLNDKLLEDLDEDHRDIAEEYLENNYGKMIPSRITAGREASFAYFSDDNVIHVVFNNNEDLDINLESLTEQELTKMEKQMRDWAPDKYK